VTPPLGVWDPLGLIESRDMRRYTIMEIKHGRAAMLGFLHVIAIEVSMQKQPIRAHADCLGLASSYLDESTGASLVLSFGLSI